MKKTFAIALIIISLATATLVLARGLYYAPNDEVELVVEPTPTATSTATATSTSSNVATITSSAPPVTQKPSTSVSSELPQNLIIPKLNINARVQHLGVTSTGNMAAPKNFTDASWYKYGTVPGLKGSAVMAAHVDNALGTPAVFYDLPKLQIGDDVYVVDGNGKRLHFRVIGKGLYPWNDSPVEKIFNDSSGKYLNLITCQGEWVAEARSAANRLVVYTQLVE